MKIYLVRHGETEGNTGGYHQTPETPLTQKGEEQAKSVAERLKGLEINFIYASTHLRAQKTAKIISDALNIPVESWGELTEMRRPREIRGKSIQEPEIKKLENLVEENFGNKEWRLSDEENFFDLVNRGKQVFDHLISQHSDQTVLCVSHGTFIKVLVTLAVFGESLTPDLFKIFRHHAEAENTGISILEYTEKRGFRLLSWNDTSHL